MGVLVRIIMYIEVHITNIAEHTMHHYILLFFGIYIMLVNSEPILHCICILSIGHSHKCTEARCN